MESRSTATSSLHW
ncbi:unnamed protein product [Linum tenue]|uniref:Uncharacterized protein n=1 Tax=Linum tenue TaxID=586396 RepID=A0AAV0H0R3_9ROSI|nr:unnamed protein product [Linum tenue]